MSNTLSKNKKLLKIGLTGGIGSGKTTVCRIFEVLGVPLYNADARAKELQNTHPELKKKLIQHFGEKIYDTAGKLDRKALSDLIFSNPKALKIANELIHPVVRNDFALWAESQKNTPYILKEAAILFESQTAQALDAIIVVTAPKTIRIQRVVERDKISPEAVKQRIKNQMSEQEKIERADFVIKNFGTHLLIPQVLKIHQTLKNKT